MTFVEFTEWKTRQRLFFNPAHIVAVVDKQGSCMIYTTGAKSSGEGGLNFRVLETYSSVMKALGLQG